MVEMIEEYGILVVECLGGAAALAAIAAVFRFFIENGSTLLDLVF